MEWACCAPQGPWRNVWNGRAIASIPHPHRKYFCIFWCVGTMAWSQQSAPVGTRGRREWQSPACMWGLRELLLSPFPVFLWMLSSGWVGSKHFQKFSTARLFPQLFCLSCVERSQQNCGWRRENWEKYSTGISCVGCAERSCVWNDKSVRLNTHSEVGSALPAPHPSWGCRRGDPPWVPFPWASPE